MSYNITENMKIAVFGNNYQKEDQIKTILETLRDYKIDVYMERSFLEYLNSSYSLCNSEHILDESNIDTDMVISIGGDGTFLRTAAKIGDKEIPIWGVNTGRLGFLADTLHNDFEVALQEILANNYRVEERTRLSVEVNQSLDGDSYTALNEVAILKQDTASMITVNVTIDNEFLTAYEADGLLISTPTGSTAYAMSAGGPILSPTLSNFMLTPIAPHTLTSRPLVIDDCAELFIEVESRNVNYLLSLDGRSTILPTTTSFKVKKAPYPQKVVRRTSQSFYDTLRNKLMWGADPRTNKE